MKFTIEKGGCYVGGADTLKQRLLLSDGDWKGIKYVFCNYFPRFQLSPPLTFEHLAGESLGRFLDHSTLFIDGVPSRINIRYIHGRSEVMRASNTVSAVLLGTPVTHGNDLSDQEWLTYLPDIYRKFLEVLDTDLKTA